MISYSSLPQQQLPFSKKTKEWRKQHINWAENRIFFSDSPIRASFLRKKINYDLLRGKLNMEDLAKVLNPDQVSASFVPETIQHYPIMNSKLNVLRGEELKRRFNFRGIVTNPNAVSAIETAKRAALLQRLQEVIENQGLSEEETLQAVEDLQFHFNYEWQDLREMRLNYLLKHYIAEYNIPILFNEGFMDALTVGEEMYQCDIVGGEPTLVKLNPQKVGILMSGYSNKVEDADVIILTDYWSRGKIIDHFYDILTPKEIKTIETMCDTHSDSMDNIDERASFFYSNDIDYNNTIIDNFLGLGVAAEGLTTNYFDDYGNIRVLRIYWKSRRKIKKIKSYDPQTGDVIYSFHTEHYVPNPSLGEEETIYWINEGWEATKIGKDGYIGMGPRLVQYNRLSNPSRCHFGIIGTIYNLNEGKPFSLVDHMKPFTYLYNVIHDRLNKAIAANWGKLLKLDLAMVPKGWEVDKWMYFAKINKIAVTDSFKEGNSGVAQGKLAGMMNNQSSGVIDAETGNYIQQHIYLLEAIKQEMSEVAGISRQREGQISNRETVGGVERSNLQSSHITEYYFALHDDLKKRVLEAFVETAKIALKGGSLKFQYILPDSSSQIIEIDGDDFADADYGIVVDNSPETLNLDGSLRQLAQAAMQNGTMTFSSIMKIMASPSMAEIQRTIERDERDMQKRQSEAAQAERDSNEQIKALELELKQAELELKEAELEQKDIANQRDNATKLTIAQLKSLDEEGDGIITTQLNKEELLEKARQFNETLQFNKEKLAKEVAVKKEAINKKSIKNV